MTNNQTRNKRLTEVLTTNQCVCKHNKEVFTDEEEAALLGMTYSEYMEYCIDNEHE